MVAFRILEKAYVKNCISITGCSHDKKLKKISDGVKKCHPGSLTSDLEAFLRSLS
jgi:hypothetical protein